MGDAGVGWRKRVDLLVSSLACTGEGLRESCRACQAAFSTHFLHVFTASTGYRGQMDLSVVLKDLMT